MAEDEEAAAAHDRLERAFASHEAFERDGGQFAVTTTALDAVVRLRETDADPEVRVRVFVPTIDAVVAGETVAPVVSEGWLETFERRLEDVGGATRSAPERPTASLDASEKEVVVETTIVDGRPGIAVEDAKAVVEYVEGTFVEGIIPGYTYREPAAGLIDRARSAGER